MTDEQKVKIKEKFKEGKYDVISFILDNDLIKINLSNYEKFCDEVVNIFNEVRINRSILFFADGETSYLLGTSFSGSNISFNNSPLSSGCGISVKTSEKSPSVRVRMLVQ